ncbi:MAG: UDP-N-acetylmuramoyl-L-alanyl-D-glutamate--2,6-diaminopimelate ligase, partial [Elusimicrobia bacterium]|nr:UDP-N-acetylmuramoyl-L-alanyl-D-glutamate--2,6-diaminopimelate ligase [Elusimicrobiota bacterium]
MRLRELAVAAGINPSKEDGDVEISGLRHDSRLIRPGELFFALPGSRTDGNRHVKEACARGAAAIVSELKAPPPPALLPARWLSAPDVTAAMGRMADRFFGHPSGAMTVVGVTGTNGKTTTTYLLESILCAAKASPGVIGTVDYRLSGQKISPAPNTTPLSLELQRLLAAFRDGGATHACLEISSHALALKRVEEIDFDAAVFTNLSRDHLDFHKTTEDYLSAKARLFELLASPANRKPGKVAAVNGDDPRHEALRRAARPLRPLFFGLGAGNDVRAEELRPTLAGSTFDLLWNGRRLKAEIRLPGEHNVYNALAAATAALGLGLAPETVLSGLAALSRVPGRLEPICEGQDFAVLVDYAHTDAALSCVLAHLARLPHRRILTVFGCGGERDRGKRGPMGVAACRGSDLAVLTSDNPRREDPAGILADIVAGL